MGEQDKIAFEKARMEEGYVLSDGSLSNENYKLTERWFNLGYQSVNLESAERIAALEKDIEEYKASTMFYWQQNEEFKANNHDLREALRYFVDSYGYVSFISDDDKESEEQVIAARKLLAATSAESLAKHDNEVIERCAIAMENYHELEGIPAMYIRALKVNK